MYKGNMTDFVESVDRYLGKYYDCKIILISATATDNRNFVALFAPGQVASMGYEVYDTENFEQQIYDYVNKSLENVQGEYNGFYNKLEQLHREDISSSEFEDN